MYTVIAVTTPYLHGVRGQPRGSDMVAPKENADDDDLPFSGGGAQMMHNDGWRSYREVQAKM